MNDKLLQFDCPLEAFIIYPNFRINLLNGEKDSSQNFRDFLQKINCANESKHAIVIHFFYEFHQQIERLNSIDQLNSPVAIYIQYEGKPEEIRLEQYQSSEKLTLSTVQLFSQQSYQSQFKRVKKHLVDGDCYQVNLTNQCYFKLDKEEISAKKLEENFWSQKDSLSKMAHLTYVHSLHKMFISNSPECLFQIKKKGKGLYLRTYPIKGTMPISKQEDQAKVVENLLADKKNTSELNIITDLMRNDLSCLTKRASRVLNSSAILEVPGLVHLYSIIETRLNGGESLLDILEAMYPGGSITGAPKKLVIQLINQIETGVRGFYTGSTLLWFQSIKVSNINIRSTEIDLESGELKYGCGGGITLNSQELDEYNESFKKVESFIRTFFHLKM